MGERVVERAFAKVNLWLEILRRRDDGYHELETVMHEVDLADRLVLEAGGDDVVLEVDDPSVGTGEDNLAVRAVRALERRVGRALPSRITLEKRIPAGGGMGGGSSDAAAAIRAADRAHGLDLGFRVLEEVAAEVGSDVAFFIRGGTALCTGRGEIVQPLVSPQSLWFLLILPAVHVPTGPIFQSLQLTGSPRGSYDCLSCVESGDIAGIRRNQFNRLEGVALEAYPSLRDLHTRLKPHAPLMSGSGSTIFILCDDEVDAERRQDGISGETGLRVERVRSASR